MEWSPDPILFDFGKLQIRYYGLFFATGIFIGYLFWQKNMQRRGHSEELAETYVVWGFLAIIIGARLGHCLFYEPQFYFQNPIEILKVWKGGLASHGAFIAIIISLILFHRVKKVPLFDVMDSISMAAAISAISIRLGNFMNSEIVGRVTDVPWGIKFPLYEKYVEIMTKEPQILQPRHPSQLYEAGMGLIILIALYLINRIYKEKCPPSGMLVGALFSLYFTGRFIVEYFKEYQAFSPDMPFTMGQLLSVPFALAGYTVFFLAVFRKPQAPEEMAPPPKKDLVDRKTRRREKKKNSKGRKV